jgi:hypothetical protein
MCYACKPKCKNCDFNIPSQPLVCKKCWEEADPSDDGMWRELDLGNYHALIPVEIISMTGPVLYTSATITPGSSLHTHTWQHYNGNAGV